MVIILMFIFTHFTHFMLADWIVVGISREGGVSGIEEDRIESGKVWVREHEEGWWELRVKWPIIFLVAILELFVMTDNPKNAGAGHVFSLIRLRPECKIAPTVADFAPPFATHPLARSCAPCFNADQSHCTPSFLLPADAKTQEHELETDRIHFQERLREVLLSEESEGAGEAAGALEAAVPSSTYCQICREHFRSYEEHVEQKSHILRWHHNEFNQDIHLVCQSLSPPPPPPVPSPKTKPIAKTPRLLKVNSVKYSPKTRVEYESRRRMSVSLGEGMVGMELQEVSFNLAAE